MAKHSIIPQLLTFDPPRPILLFVNVFHMYIMYAKAHHYPTTVYQALTSDPPRPILLYRYIYVHIYIYVCICIHMTTLAHQNVPSCKQDSGVCTVICTYYKRISTYITCPQNT